MDQSTIHLLNTIAWQNTQIMMWVIGLQTLGIIAVFGALWHRINKLEERMDKFDGKMQLLQNDLIEIKIMLRMKECCMIKDDRQLHKVE